MERKKRCLSICCMVALLVVLLAVFSACDNQKSEAPMDVLSQKIPDSNRIPVTVLVKNAFSINAFEEAAEKVFPALDIIQVANYSSNMGIAEYEARLRNGDITDMVMTWPLEVGEEYWDDCLMDLSALPFTSHYNAARLNEISKDGKLYYLPGPSQVRAIVYNKTMFRENGWTVPTDFAGFIALCKEIEKSGTRALQLGLGNEEVLDTAFIGYSLESCFKTPADMQWISDYNQGKGSFASHFAPALDTFQTLIDNKILQPGDLKLTYSDREEMIFNRQCAMVEDSVLVARMGEKYNGCTDEFGLMPFFNPGDNSDWSRIYPVCYIGLNKNLEEHENKEKYELVLRLMDYISSPEGQIALLGDTGAMISALNGVVPPNVPEVADIMGSLEQGRYLVFPVLKNAQSALRCGLASMVEGKLTGEQVGAMVDKQNVEPPKPAVLDVLGEATSDFSMIETGNFITDAMREKSNCEIALFLDNGKDGRYNGKGICGKIYKGDVTEVDLNRILPDLRKKEKCELWKVKMTGADLLHTLEYSILVDNDNGGWFYYFSGLKMEYEPAANPGMRIHSISLADGEKIDPKKIYSVAVMDESVPEDVIISKDDTDILIRDILKETLAEGSISPSCDGRFTVIVSK